MPRESPDDILKEGPPIRPEPDVLDWRPDSYWNSDGARIEAAFRDEAFVIYSSTLIKELSTNRNVHGSKLMEGTPESTSGAPTRPRRRTATR